MCTANKRLSRLGLVSAIVALSTSSAALAQQAQKRMTLTECMGLAASRSHDVLSAYRDIQAASADYRGAKAAYGPRLKFEGNITQWNQAIVRPLGMADGMSAGSITIRDSRTATGTLSLIQPISALIAITHNVKVNEKLLSATKAQATQTRQLAAFAAADAYVRLLQTRKLLEVSRTSLTQVESQVKRAQSFFERGSVGKNDVLRAELARSRADQQHVQMQGQVELARTRLALLLRLPADTPLEPVEPERAALPSIVNSVGQAEAVALERRPEVWSTQLRMEQSRANVSLARSRLYPEVNAIAAYQRNEGLGAFQPKDAAYIGAFASWNLWDWGANYRFIEAARARSNRATIEERKLRDNIRLEVRAAFIDFRTATHALNVNEKAIQQAEENYRVEQRRYEVAANTSFDVLDAEALLTQAKAQQATAYYDLQLARLALLKATGLLLDSKYETPRP